MVRVSKNMTGKMEGILAINTSPFGNRFCGVAHRNANSVCGHCYSWRALTSYRKSAERPFRRNGDLLSGSILPESELPTFGAGAVVRFNAHGEVINWIHALNLVRIVLRSPKTLFGWFTKRPILVEYALGMTGKPENLQVIYSCPWIDSSESMEVASWIDKVFYVVTKGPVTCKGHCRECMVCYTKNDVRVVREKLK